MVWLVCSAAFGVLLAVLYVLNRRAAFLELERQMRSLLAEALNVEVVTEKVEVLKALAELKRIATPWYERSLSAIGVVAFFSMSLATAIQTVRATNQEARVGRLQAEVAHFEEEIEAAEKFLGDVAQAAISGARASSELGELERRLLRYRLERLLSASALGEEEVREVYALAVVLRDFRTAVEVVERNIELLDEASPADRLSLSEYYFLVGSHDAAKGLLDGVLLDEEALSRGQRRRAIVLRSALLPGDLEVGVRGLARLDGLSQEEARIVLDRELYQLRGAAGSLVD